MNNPGGVDRRDLILDKLREYNWQEAMEYCDWKKSHVARIMASVEGENDGENWLMVVELDDGSYGFLSAGCDFTGWDCRAEGMCHIEQTLEGLIRFGMGKEERDRLGYSLPEDNK